MNFKWTHFTRTMAHELLLTGPNDHVHDLVGGAHNHTSDYTDTLGLLGLGVSTGDIIMYSDAGTTEKARWDGATGFIGIGTSPVTTSIIKAAATIASGGARTLDFDLGISSYSAILPATGVRSVVSGQATSGTSQEIIAVMGRVQSSGAGGTITNATAIKAELGAFAAGTITAASAFRAVTNGAFTVSPSTLYVFNGAHDMGTAASITTLYGLYLGAQTATNSRSFIADPLVIGTDAAPPASTKLTVTGGAAALLNENALRLYDSGSSNYIGHRSNNARTTDIMYVWPITDPTAGQILSAAAPSGGVSALSWIAAGAGGGHTIQDDNAAMTSRTNLSFQDGFVLADDAGGDQTEVDLSYGAAGYPQDVASAEADGTAITVARADHVHAHEAAHINHDTTWATKGDLIVATANDTAAVLAAGSNNKVVLAASGEATGLKYDYVYHEVTITIENPTASENFIVRQFTQDITITAIQASVIGGTSVTIDPEHGSTTTTATKLLSAAESVASASTTGEHIGGTGTAMAASFNDATLSAGDFLRLETTAISGSPTQLSVTFKYRLT